MEEVKKEMEFLLDPNTTIFSALIEDYRSIIKVDLESGTAFIVKSKDVIVTKENIILWQDYVAKEITSQIFEDDLPLLNLLSLEKMKEYYYHKTSSFPLEIRCVSKNKVYDWIKVNVIILKSDREELLITTKVINEDHMMKKIIDMYVYNNLDYFVLLDINKNSYTMFSGDSKTPLPPVSGDDYEAEVKRYNTAYIVPEEVEIATENMMIANVMKKLNNCDTYGFSTGFINLEGEYRRSRIQFSYYDKAAGLIVITRTDITQIYLEEREKERKLLTALRKAKHDAMTNLYNNKATSELVSNALQHQYRQQAVLFFIDIDNFKLVNDTFGHQTGDDLICFVAKKISDIASKDGIAGRIGGDEFLLFLPVMNNIGKIQGYAQEVCKVLQTYNDKRISQLPISCSVGISVYPDNGTNYEELLYKADQALYDAKRYGKGCFSFYSSLMLEKNIKQKHIF